ncbi:MAG: hypothetical protein ACR2NK_07895 [Mariniblastus sp.]
MHETKRTTRTKLTLGIDNIFIILDERKDLFLIRIPHSPTIGMSRSILNAGRNVNTRPEFVASVCNSDRRLNCDGKRLALGYAQQIPEVQKQHWNLGENCQRIEQPNSPTDLSLGTAFGLIGP